MKERVVLPSTLHFEVLPWHQRQALELSQFDKILRNKWNEAMKKGLFLHNVESEPSRIPGGRNYVAVLCRNRATQKRKPQSFMKLKQEMNPNSFNFTKVKENEILFDLDISDDAANDTHIGNLNGFRNTVDETQACVPETSFIINNSPYEFGHSLLVPEVKKLHIQSITLDAIRLGIEVLLKSSHPGFRLMYNSLCAGASVNHLHLHCYYTEYWLNSEAFGMHPLQFTPEVSSNGVDESVSLEDCFELDFNDSCVRGFGFIITKENYKSRLPKIIFKVVQYFNGKNIPHNIVIIRGLPPNIEYSCNSNDSTPIHKNSAEVNDPNIPLILDDNLPYVDVKNTHSDLLNCHLLGRVYIFPRLPLLGEKCYRKFLVNVTELFGHLYFGDVEVFNSMQEKDVVKALNSVSLSEIEFENVKGDIIKAISEYSLV